VTTMQKGKENGAALAASKFFSPAYDWTKSAPPSIKGRETRRSPGEGREKRAGRTFSKEAEKKPFLRNRVRLGRWSLREKKRGEVDGALETEKNYSNASEKGN